MLSSGVGIHGEVLELVVLGVVRFAVAFVISEGLVPFGRRVVIVQSPKSTHRSCKRYCRLVRSSLDDKKVPIL